MVLIDRCSSCKYLIKDYTYKTLRWSGIVFADTEYYCGNKSINRTFRVIDNPAEFGCIFWKEKPNVEMEN